MNWTASYVEWLADRRRYWMDAARKRKSYGERYDDEMGHARQNHAEMRQWQTGVKQPDRDTMF